MLLATMSAAGDEAECTRLLATGIPSLLPCELSGLALTGEEGWKIVFQKDGRLLDRSDTRGVLPELDSLFVSALSRDELSLSPAGGGGATGVLPSQLASLGVQRLAVVPIRTVQSKLGMLFIGRAEETELSRGEASLVQILADQTAMAIENYRLHQLLRRYSRDLEELVEERTTQLRHSESHLRLLLETNNAIIGNLDRESLFEKVAENLRAVVSFDRASIALFDPKRDVLTVVALAGPLPSKHVFPVGTETPRTDSPLRQVVDERRPLLCPNLETRRRLRDEDRLLEEGIRSYMAVPLVVGGRVIGTLNVGSRSERQWEEDVRIVSEIANQVALAIENMLAYEEIGKLKACLEQENRFLQEEIETQRSDEIVGESPAIKDLLEQVELVARTDASVLILGESGTGKELVAREIHKRSRRSHGPMIKVNCASVPRELYESEFFGHAKGAFTGATRDRSGRFELADGGTLFLDEVGEIPLELQSKLLRVLQDGQFERVGGESTRTVDVRIVAATNRDLRSEVGQGRFREDLFYRLNVFPIDVGPLRDRKEDIPLLATRFLEMACRRMNRAPCSLSEENLQQLQSYDWPGNVRELQNGIERALILSRSGSPVIEAPTLRDSKSRTTASESRSAVEIRTYEDLKRLEKETVSAALEKANGKVHGAGGAAELMGVKPSTLFSRIKAMGIERPW